MRRGVRWERSGPPTGSTGSEYPALVLPAALERSIHVFAYGTWMTRSGCAATRVGSCCVCVSVCVRGAVRGSTRPRRHAEELGCTPLRTNLVSPSLQRVLRQQVQLEGAYMRVGVGG